MASHNVDAATGTGTGCNYVYAALYTAINNACPNTVLSIAGGVTLGNVQPENQRQRGPDDRRPRRRHDPQRSAALL